MKRSKMKNCQGFLLFGLMCCLSASARDRSAEEMTSAARSVLMRVAATAGDSAPKLQRIAVLRQQPLQVVLEKNNLAVVGQQNVGFAVIAKDARHSAVWGYSDRPFVTDDFSPSFLWLMDAMDEAFAEASAQDQCLRACAQVITAAESDEGEEIIPIVAPLIKTRWYQKEPYNRLCPMVVNEGEEVRGVTGCVPTALAQFIYYYQQPTCGEGVSGIRTVDDFYNYEPTATFTADLSTMPWDFQNMLLDYSGDYTDEQAIAVAQLMQACGYICWTDYGPTQSAGCPIAPYSLTGDYIGYRTKELQRKAKDDITEYLAALDNGDPIYCTGYSHEKGFSHAFLVDGYDSQGFLHVNFGWAGREDGYYAAANLNTFSLAQAFVLNEKGIKKVVHDGICFDLNPVTHTASVRVNNYFSSEEGFDRVVPYSGDFVIPATVEDEGIVYPVTRLVNGISRDVRSITLPSTLEKIEERSIGFSRYLTDVVCYAQQPPAALGNFSFSSSCPVRLFVPGETLEAYRSTEPWCNFAYIYPLSQLEKVAGAKAEASSHAAYDLQGRALPERGSGVARGMWRPLRIVDGKKIK